jgi:hypothetical protein
MGAGRAVFSNKAGAITGVLWVWGQSVLTFETSKAVINGVNYDYTFDRGTKQGTIQKIGDFEAGGDRITIRNWRKSSFTVTFTRGTGAAPGWNGSLIGTAWGWQNAFNGWMILEFMTQDKVILTFTNSVYHDDIPFEYGYTYQEADRNGNIPTQGTFNISASRKTLSFVQWRDYPHGADYTRIE